MLNVKFLNKIYQVHQTRPVTVYGHQCTGLHYILEVVSTSRLRLYLSCLVRYFTITVIISGPEKVNILLSTNKPTR